MKHFKLLSLAALALGLFTTTAAFAQADFMGHNPPPPSDCPDGNCNVDGYVRIVRPLQCQVLSHINFGAIYAGNAGTATITPNNSTTAENNTLRSLSGLTGVAFSGPNSSANNLADGDGVEQGQIRFTGEAGFSYHLTVSSPSWSNGSNTIGVSNVTFAAQSGVFAYPNGVLSGSIATPGSGSQTLNVGCTLAVAANQAPGIYHGVIAVTAAYN